MNDPRKNDDAPIQPQYFYRPDEMGSRPFQPNVSTSAGAVIKGHHIYVGVVTKARGTGSQPHRHPFEQFNYVLKGWIKFVYEGQGEHTLHAGDCVLQPPNIVHNELDCSDDLEILEIYSPAVHPTVVVERMPEAAAAAR